MITETEFKDAFARYPDAAPLAADVVLAGGRRRLRRRRLVAVAGSVVVVLAVAGVTGSALTSTARTDGGPTATVTPASVPATDVPDGLGPAYAMAATYGYGHGRVRMVQTPMDAADRLTHLGLGPDGIGYLVEFQGPFTTTDADYVYVQRDVISDRSAATTSDVALPLESLGEVATYPDGKAPTPTASPTSVTDESCTTPSSTTDDGTTVPENVLDMIDVVRREVGKTVEVNWVSPGPNPGYALVEYCGEALRGGNYPVGSDAPMLRMEVALQGTASGRSFSDDRSPMSTYGPVHHLSVQRIEELRGAPPNK